MYIIYISLSLSRHMYDYHDDSDTAYICTNYEQSCTNMVWQQSKLIPMTRLLIKIINPSGYWDVSKLLSK